LFLLLVLFLSAFHRMNMVTVFNVPLCELGFDLC